MTVMRTGISWTDSTWNPTVGCTKVSAGCLHCYAEATVNRLWGGGFETVRLYPERLKAVHGFQPIKEGDARRPRMVFVNSMSDLMHDQVPDSFRDQVFDAIEQQPYTVFQILTKRPMTLRRYIERRYKVKGVPSHVWLGVSVEDNRVRGRLDTLRRLKDAVGEFTAIASVEPLIGPVDKCRFVGVDWLLFGGESRQGKAVQRCDIAWVRQAIEQGHVAGAALWGKQWGEWANNPLYRASQARTHLARVEEAIAHGEQLAVIEHRAGKPVVIGEKGGATFDGKTYRELPAMYRVLTGQLAHALVQKRTLL